ncbi:MAG: CcoQ/FixQ family Cbb3-type cytochrome c oxidase assembly chaperone [Alphaproteobacteria bacterium]|nr:CcoQ/FixQ family Cbb3-type cytochrome c oxidase assembly chaperone [Alphaproteobacteria bacterium]
MTYETATSFAQIWGMFFFIIVFGAVLVYALWPSNREKFDRAARSPLNDDIIED